MNQIQNSHESFDMRSLSSQIQAKPLKQLEKEIKQLKKLASELNPYLPISAKHKKALADKNIVSEDPFIITNKLLLLLEESLVELQNRSK